MSGPKRAPTKEEASVLAQATADTQVRALAKAQKALAEARDAVSERALALEAASRLAQATADTQVRALAEAQKALAEVLTPRQRRRASVAQWVVEARTRDVALAETSAEAARARVAELEAEAEALVEEGLALAVQAEAMQAQAQALARANRALGVVELLVPKRIANEELGDAMEHVCSMVERGAPRWHVYFKVLTTIFWVLLHAFRAYGRATARKAVKKKG
jgi:hypothetical protein